MTRASGAEPTAAAASRWDRFWFGEASLVRLGAFRIAILAVALFANHQYRIGVFQHADELDPRYLSRMWNPIYAFEVLGIGPMGAVAARIVYGTLVIAIVMGMLGLYTRVSCAVAAILTFLWIGTNYSYGKPHHDCVALMFGLLALPLGPVGARLSLDAIIARVRRARRGEDPVPSLEVLPYAALPWRVTQITVALGYFFAGSSKLAIGGLEWANGYTLQGTMLEFNAPWTAALTGNVFLCRLMSIGLLVVQASFPLIFLSPRLRWFYVPMGTLFHLLSWQTMSTGPYFTLWFTMVSFVPLDRVPDFARDRVTSGPAIRRVICAVALIAVGAFIADIYCSMFPPWLVLALVPLVSALILYVGPPAKLGVLYDGSCGVCKTTIAWLVSLDWSRKLAIRDLTDWDHVHALHPTLDREACLRDMHAMAEDGRVFVGYAAYQAIARRLPAIVLFSPLMALPGVSHAGRAIYRRVADRRWRTACSVTLSRTPVGARVTAGKR